MLVRNILTFIDDQEYTIQNNRIHISLKTKASQYQNDIQSEFLKNLPHSSKHNKNAEVSSYSL